MLVDPPASGVYCFREWIYNNYRPDITVKTNNEQPEIILDENYIDLIQHKVVSPPYTFSQ